MIKPEELRTGNWVECNGYGQINLNSFDVLHIGQYKNFNPINLSPEILEMCGFYKEGNTFDRMRFELHYNADFDEYRFNRVDGGSTSVIELHQLQNLYFSLYGEELTINLSVVNKQAPINH